MNGYAVLGWGSLIWDMENLAPHVRGDWAMGAGPALPMEFTRVSPKRKMGLVVCLDATHGSHCTTHAIASTKDGIQAVAIDLARETPHGAMRLTGIAGLPTYNRGVADHQYLFVNGRPVKDRLLTGALRGAYADMLARDRHAGR